MVYDFRVRDLDGSVLEGEVEAANEELVRAKLLIELPTLGRIECLTPRVAAPMFPRN